MTREQLIASLTPGWHRTVLESIALRGRVDIRDISEPYRQKAIDLAME